MTLLDFEELCAYWSEHPPTHIMVAAYLGVKPKTPVPTSPSATPGSAGDFSQLAAIGGMLQRDAHEGFSEPPILDIEEFRRATALGRPS